MTTWFTSDLHFNHKKILEYSHRPFTDVETMNEALIENWNMVVQEDDTVFCLGDMVMGNRDEGLKLIKRLKGYKKLLPGNHDRCWEGDKKHDEWLPKYEEVFEEVKLPGDTWMIKEPDFLLNHFPYHGDSQKEDRYIEHRPHDKGLPLLCGHVHDAWLVRDNQINVGVDAPGWDYSPVKLEQLILLAIKEEII